MSRSFITLFIAFTFCSLVAQNRVDIRFNPTTLGETESCFDFELRSLENSEFVLAGQNYRIFFNSNKIEMKSDELNSYGNKTQYSKLKSLRKHHSDEIDVTMINLAVEALKYSKTQGIILKPQQWTKTSNACFSHDKNAQFELTWARAKVTADLATAYVSLAQWTAADKQAQIVINEYFDFNKNDIGNDQVFQADINIYPNPVIDLVNLKIGAFGNMEKGRMMIVDATGKMFSTLDIHKGISAYQVDMNSAPEGNYFLEILNEKLLF